MELKKSAEEMELDREEVALRNSAAEVDPARPDDATHHDDANPGDGKRATSSDDDPSKNSQRTGGAKKPDVTAAAKADASKANDKPGQKSDANKPDAKPDPKAPADKQLTEFQKERHRLNDGWKSLTAERERTQKERAQLDADRKALEEQQRRQPSKPADKPKIDGGTAEDWDAVAKDYEDDGKKREAEIAKNKASKLRELEKAQGGGDAGARRGERFSQAEIDTMTKEWQGHLERLGKDNPELAKDDSPLRVRVGQLLQAMPILHKGGDGIVLAVEFAKADLKAKQAEELEKKVAELETENKRLMGLTSLPAGGAQPDTKATKFEDMTDAEQEAALREDAVAASR